MSEYIDSYKEYKIIKSKNSYIVINTKGEYKNHSHFKKLSTCYVIIRLVKNKTIPNKPFMIQAAKRLTLDIKYKEKLKNKQIKNKEKQYYYNINKRVDKKC